jgi:hypothetical protein
MPYLANKPFSFAIINGAESVKAIKPSLAVVTSGVSAAATGLGADELPVDVPVDAVLEELHPLIMNVAAVVAPAVNRKLRLEIFDIVCSLRRSKRDQDWKIIVEQCSTTLVSELEPETKRFS